MKKSRVLATSAVIALLISTSAFAVDTTTQNTGTQDKKTSISRNFKNFGNKKGMGGQQNFRRDKVSGNLKKQDPLKMLENRKTRIQTMLQTGKITADKASTELTNIETKIKEMQAFNALTLDQKKEKLTNDFKTNIQKQVTALKLTQEKADTMVKNYTDKLAKWDGTGNFRIPRNNAGIKNNKNNKNRI